MILLLLYIHGRDRIIFTGLLAQEARSYYIALLFSSFGLLDWWETEHKNGCPVSDPRLREPNVNSGLINTDPNSSSSGFSLVVQTIISVMQLVREEWDQPVRGSSGWLNNYHGGIRERVVPREEVICLITYCTTNASNHVCGLIFQAPLHPSHGPTTC